MPSPYLPQPNRRATPHSGLAAVMLCITVANVAAVLATHYEMGRVIAASDANVDRQERIRARQFAEIRQQISEDMADQSAASDAGVQRVIGDWFGAAGNRMSAVSERREKALKLIGAKLGVDSAQLDAIFAEPLPPYPTAPPACGEPDNS